jgi:hypothetical protein
MINSIIFKAALVGAIFGAGFSARADRQGPRRPPQAAFDACTSKASGDACQVTLGEHVIAGTCATTPEQKLACRPDHMPAPPEQGHEPGAPPTN